MCGPSVQKPQVEGPEPTELRTDPRGESQGRRKTCDGKRLSEGTRSLGTTGVWGRAFSAAGPSCAF